MSFSSNLNPKIVKTALDKVFYPEFNLEEMAQIGLAKTEAIFKQDSAENSAVITELFKGSGYWGQRLEEQDVPQAQSKITNTQTHSVLNFAQSQDVPKNMFDDAKFSAVERMVRDMAMNGRVTQNKHAFGIFRDAFSGSTYTTSDGVSLINNSHTNINGDTVDNMGTGVLSPANLETGLVALMEQLAQDGTIKGHKADVLLVPPALYKDAVEIVESELISDSADNAINWSKKYGLAVYTSPYLGAAAGGSDSAWFLLARTHSITRWVRQEITTDLVDYKYQRNNNYIYKGEYREVIGVISYDGVWGSNGTV